MTISKKKKLLILDEKNVQVLAFLGSIQLSLSQKPLVIEKKTLHHTTGNPQHN